jgi:hypothetical protein
MFLVKHPKSTYYLGYWKQGCVTMHSYSYSSWHKTKCSIGTEQFAWCQEVAIYY